jgi:hypothetical protein
MPQFIHKAYAWIMGYFWLPCKKCGHYFGGHQIYFWSGRIRIGKDVFTVCPQCSKEGIIERPVTYHRPVDEREWDQLGIEDS